MGVRIDTAFPSTAKVARTLGVPAERVEEIKRMVGARPSPNSGRPVSRRRSCNVRRSARPRSGRRRCSLAPCAPHCFPRHPLRLRFSQLVPRLHCRPQRSEIGHTIGPPRGFRRCTSPQRRRSSVYAYTAAKMATLPASAGGLGVVGLGAKVKVNHTLDPSP